MKDFYFQPFQSLQADTDEAGMALVWSQTPINFPSVKLTRGHLGGKSFLNNLTMGRKVLHSVWVFFPLQDI